MREELVTEGTSLILKLNICKQDKIYKKINESLDCCHKVNTTESNVVDLFFL